MKVIGNFTLYSKVELILYLFLRLVLYYIISKLIVYHRDRKPVRIRDFNIISNILIILLIRKYTRIIRKCIKTIVILSLIIIFKRDTIDFIFLKLFPDDLYGYSGPRSIIGVEILTEY